MLAILGYVLLGILTLVILALVIPVGVRVVYEDALRVTVKIFCPEGVYPSEHLFWTARRAVAEGVPSSVRTWRALPEEATLNARASPTVASSSDSAATASVSRDTPQNRGSS